MEHRFRSGPLTLAGHLALPTTSTADEVPGLVLCHGFPRASKGGRKVADSYPELADRIAGELGWAVLTFAFRGCGESQGSFSVGGWLEDLQVATRHLRGQADVRGVWVAGFGTGGALCICAAANDPSIEGAAALGAPADFDDWASHPRRLLDHAQELGVIDERNPPALERWTRELREIRAVNCAPRIGQRPLLLVHGTEDDLVPLFDARVMADAHGAADLRVISGATHHLRDDPRAIAVLCGWLDRQRLGIP